jgi:predicted SprT family Zn-dependent metalloprotease
MNSQHLTSIARILAARWSLPKLAEDVQIDYSKRMTTALGLCLPERRTIRLNYKLRDKDTGLIEEVLCHELAHLAIYQKFGRKVKPHGP